VPGTDADTHARSDGEKCAHDGNGVPMHLSPVSHVLRLRWIHAGYHRVILALNSVGYNNSL